MGSRLDGARVIVRDAQTGEILAQGLTQRSTSDTKRITQPEGGPSAVRATNDAAKFVRHSISMRRA